MQYQKLLGGYSGQFGAVVSNEYKPMNSYLVELWSGPSFMSSKYNKVMFDGPLFGDLRLKMRVDDNLMKTDYYDPTKGQLWSKTNLQPDHHYDPSIMDFSNLDLSKIDLLKLHLESLELLGL